MSVRSMVRRTSIVAAGQAIVNRSNPGQYDRTRRSLYGRSRRQALGSVGDQRRRDTSQTASRASHTSNAVRRESLPMIGPGDDYLIHQTPELLRYVATSDRRFYDRHMLSGHSCGPGIYFQLGLGAYPNLGVIDGFASVALPERQYTTRGSRELGHDRLDTTRVGPIGLEVLEPGRRLHFWSRPEKDDPDGVTLDLEWTAAVELFEEPQHYTRSFGRVVQEGPRLVQTGYWSGSIAVAGQEFAVNPETWWGGRDRAWGVRSIGLEREPAGIMQAHKVARNRAALWVWSPMQFPTWSMHFAIGENAAGEREVETVRRIPSIGSEGSMEVLRNPQHDLKFDPETRDFIEGSVSWTEADGSETRVHMTPLARGYMRAGTGYGGPDHWRHGKYMGEMWGDSISYDITDPQLTAQLGPAHVLCRMDASTGEVGYGLFETQVYGAYPRYGFE